MKSVVFQYEQPVRVPDYDQPAAAFPPAKALLLCGETLSADERNLTQLFEFFGIAWERVCPAALDHGERYCVFSSAARLTSALEGEAELPVWMAKASSVYVYGFQETAQLRSLLRLLTGAADAEIGRGVEAEAGLSVTDGFPDLCGPMSGIQARARLSDTDTYFDFKQRPDGFQGIISGESRTYFAAVRCGGVRFFLNACSTVIDISAPATEYFDVKKHFSSAVPIAMYLKWAFSGTCWTGGEIRACLIVDDPLLKPRYGFMRFRKTLALMDAHNFTTTVAFIPWNWRRTNAETVRQFQQRSDRLSLCVHGCDHTGGEYASRSTAALNRSTKIASERMEGLLRRTSLPYERIMVFPQGSFSPETGRALKLNGFAAAVNTEVAPSGGAQNETTVADLWDIANLKYGSFAIFTRRYITHGMENFAFDALLGKPCLLVAHHDVFKDERKLAEFVEKLNSLRGSLRWCSLGEATTHSYKVRTGEDGTRAIRMFGERITIENASATATDIVVTKQECDPDCVKEITAGQTVVDYAYQDQKLQFRVALAPGQRTEIRISYHDRLETDARGDSLIYGMKTFARRHLSEFRDNYVSQSDFLYAAAVRLKRLLK